MSRFPLEILTESGQLLFPFNNPERTTARGAGYAARLQCQPGAETVLHRGSVSLLGSPSIRCCVPLVIQQLLGSQGAVTFELVKELFEIVAIKSSI